MEHLGGRFWNSICSWISLRVQQPRAGFRASRLLLALVHWGWHFAGGWRGSVPVCVPAPPSCGSSWPSPWRLLLFPSPRPPSLCIKNNY
ncbi:hypothetical protein RLOC_00005209 [Lonchura striata]|uniref:Uncharacterized protein n=1 Tax=Lonchura striata TaxID=40157 RepID=A0A218UIB2_9PASE|nr:hypothetical protein RLOC_00005209 [Lonchura striata domestica]